MRTQGREYHTSHIGFAWGTREYQGDRYSELMPRRRGCRIVYPLTIRTTVLCELLRRHNDGSVLTPCCPAERAIRVHPVQDRAGARLRCEPAGHLRCRDVQRGVAAQDADHEPQGQDRAAACVILSADSHPVYLPVMGHGEGGSPVASRFRCDLRRVGSRHTCSSLFVLPALATWLCHMHPSERVMVRA
jgi:hypothetical protein